MRVIDFLEQHRGEGFSLSDLERECNQGEETWGVVFFLEYEGHIFKVNVAGVDYYYLPLED